ncbi:MAG: hypothetical protein HUJ31_17895 [Pseudomonadales bacterium]|nr:hypothetical protein [Pseudomonadales bacterium]
MNFTLLPFRDSDLIDRFEGHISVTREKIFCHYRMFGNISRIRWPEAAANLQREYELWTTTCFEFFLGPVDNTTYLEFNLSPGGNWNSFLFSDIRTGMAETDILTLSSVKVDSPDATERQIAAFIDFHSSPSFNGQLCIGVSAVIEDVDGDFHYYALKHPGPRPDFHDRGTRTLKCEVR